MDSSFNEKNETIKPLFERLEIPQDKRTYLIGYLIGKHFNILIHLKENLPEIFEHAKGIIYSETCLAGFQSQLEMVFDPVLNKSFLASVISTKMNNMIAEASDRSLSLDFIYINLHRV